MADKWPRGNSEKHAAAAKLGWERKKKRYGLPASETRMGSFKQAAKGLRGKKRRELLHAFADDIAFYQDRDRKRRLARKTYESAPVKHVRTERARRAGKAHRSSEGRAEVKAARTSRRVRRKRAS